MRHVLVLIALSSVSIACGSDDSPSTATGPGAEQATSVSPTAEPLVGTWRRVTTCEEAVQAQTEAGFEVDPAGLAGSEWLPVVDQIADPAHPCEGAVPREHSHFWTEDGQFGSLDWNGNQVDEGTYEIIDDHTLVMPYGFEQGPPIQVEFRYEIHGDTLSLDPLIPSDCSTKHCQEAYSWSVSVAYPGKTWERVS